MITRNEITISNHPLLTDVTRKAKVFRSYVEYDTNRVIIVVDVTHYKNGVQIQYLPSRVELISDNETKVNSSTGEISEVGDVGEYDYLWYLTNTAKVYTPQELEEIYIPMRISKINEKLYGTNS